jgi:hypothetical protein
VFQLSYAASTRMNSESKDNVAKDARLALVVARLANEYCGGSLRPQDSPSCVTVMR